MRQIRVFHVDAFTTEPFCGNPAGVVPDASGLTDSDMQKIARELNLSESAFLFPSTNPQSDYRVRYFTPTEEINFCGHATVGLSWILATEYGWAEKAEKVILETNIGLVPVEWSKTGDSLNSVIMTQVTPQVREVEIDREWVAGLVGISAQDIDERYPIKLSYTGNWHLLIAVKSRAAIDSAKPNLAELEILNREQDASTTHLFTFDAPDGYDLYTRDFAPAVGIAEDPVTGAANGALAGYLMLEGFLSQDMTHHLKIAQGHAVGRPGTLFVKISVEERTPIIRVGGSAVQTIAGFVNFSE